MLELRSLSRRYRDVVALGGLSLRVEPGQMLGFVGPNGAGKTTTMRIILGLLAPDAGEVLWNGNPVDAATRRRFGYMPEERGLYPKMRVRDQLSYLTQLEGIDARAAGDRVDALLERLGLADRGGDRVEQLSLGNQQRVQLAAALVGDPLLLVLDEPFSGLDPIGVDVLAGVLQERVAAGTPVLFSSHQLDLVERLCRSVAIIVAGRLVAAGDVDDLRTTGRGDVLRVQVVDAPARWYEEVPGVQLLDADADGWLLGLNNGADPQQVLRAAQHAGTVTAFLAVRPSLTDLFREAVSS